MEIVSRQKRAGMAKGNHTVSYTDKKVKYVFELNMLELLCSYVLSTNKHISRSQIIQLRNLFELIDMDVYKNEPEKLSRLRFIRRGIEARLDHNLKTPSLIITHINGGIINGEYELSQYPELANNEIAYIDETIVGALRSADIETEMDEFFDFYTRYKNQEYRYRDSMIKEYEEMVRRVSTRLRQTKVQKAGEKAFSLDEATFKDDMSDIYDTLTSPSRFLYTGMQGFNMLVGGGLESTRVYMLLGLAGVGKSMVMLNVALQIKKFNRNYVPKDPTKIPTILFLTQENTVDETVDRICSIITGHNMAHFSKEEIIDLLINQGELTLTGENNINIHIVYRPDRSIDTGDLYTIIEDLEDDGYEVICLIQDHIKRIRSASYIQDVRLELGAVVNELKILAQIKQIPILTVSHLNRDAAEKVDSQAQGNKADLTRLLGKQNIGESLLMVDNCDAVIIVNKEYDQDNNAYMVFKNIKLRSGSLLRDYLCHPFEGGTGTKLVEDLYCQVPAYKESMLPAARVNGNVPTQLNGMSMKASGYVTNIKAIDMGEEEENLYGPFIGSKYTSTSGRTYSSNTESKDFTGDNSQPSAGKGFFQSNASVPQPLVTFNR